MHTDGLIQGAGKYSHIPGALTLIIWDLRIVATSAAAGGSASLHGAQHRNVAALHGGARQQEEGRRVRFEKMRRGTRI